MRVGSGSMSRVARPFLCIYTRWKMVRVTFQEIPLPGTRKGKGEISFPRENKHTILAVC